MGFNLHRHILRHFHLDFLRECRLFELAGFDRVVGNSTFNFRLAFCSAKKSLIASKST